MDTCSFMSFLFKILSTKVHQVDIYERSRELIDNDGVDAVVIQGSLRYGDNLVKTCLNKLIHKKITTLMIAPEGRTRQLSALNLLIKAWRRISHINVGGLTTTKWLIGSTIIGNEKSLPKNSSLFKTQGLKRRLVGCHQRHNFWSCCRHT